jgi:hypothetical protein
LLATARRLSTASDPARPQRAPVISAQAKEVYVWATSVRLHGGALRQLALADDGVEGDPERPLPEAGRPGLQTGPGMTPRIVFSASTSAAVAKSPAPLSMRLSRWPYMLRTSSAPARAPALATAASPELAYESIMPCRLSRRCYRPGEPSRSEH